MRRKDTQKVTPSESSSSPIGHRPLRNQDGVIGTVPGPMANPSTSVQLRSTMFDSVIDTTVGEVVALIAIDAEAARKLIQGHTVSDLPGGWTIHPIGDSRFLSCR